MERSLFEREADALRAVLGELVASPLMEQFASVWEDIGIEEAHLEGRRETIKVHLQTLLEEMLQEEVELKTKLEASVASCSEELMQLCRELSLPLEQPPEGWTLLAKEKHLRIRADILTKEKHDRVKRFKRLTEMESAMCQAVGEVPQLAGQWAAQVVPSEEELGLFRKKIEELEEKKNRRQAVFFKTREEVLHLWEELEVEPRGELELTVAKGDLKAFTLSEDNMAILKQLHQKIQDDAIEREAAALKLRAIIQSLWERLEVPQSERESFSGQHSGFKPRVIQALQDEVERLNELKKQNLQRFVEATRSELHKIWDLCFYGEQQRREFAPAYSGEFTDDLLCAHESELDRMRGFYEDNREVFKMVERREHLWRKAEEFERKANDPNKYHNRGGQLLREEKMRRQVIKELPKVEKELKSVLMQWENDHERHFVVHDNRYLDNIEKQWEDKNSEKEQEKMKRQKVRQETTMTEMTFGSKPNTTPVKRRAPASPSSAPSKVRRVGPSPLVHSSRLTHTVTSSRKPPPAGGKTPTRKKIVGGVSRSRKILGEKNVSVASSIPPDDSFLSQANASLASTGSYTDFQHGLTLGLESQKSARSSAIPKSSSLNNMA